MVRIRVRTRDSLRAGRCGRAVLRDPLALRSIRTDLTAHNPSKEDLSGALDARGVARLQDVMAGRVERSHVPGLAWLVARRGEVHVCVAGTLTTDGGAPVRRDTLFRVS